MNSEQKKAKLKAADYCAYQERTQQQVRDKLYDYGLRSDEVEEVLTDLIMDGFVNEERYARAYAGGKFRMKKWGRIKIVNGLKASKISTYCIDKGLLEIDDGEYKSTLQELIEKKRSTVTGTNPLLIKKKLANYALQKGYEPELVWGIVNEIVNSRE